MGTETTGADTLHASLWLDTTVPTVFEPLQEDLKVEVAVLGGGIVGVTAALLLRDAGLDVALIDATRIGHGVTGHTTAKVTSLHGLIYTKLARKVGKEAARDYGHANEEGIDLVAGMVERLEIDCEFRRRDNFTYAEEERDRSKLETEAELAAELGLPAELVETVDLPFPTAGAVKFRNQAEFHPLRYLYALTEHLAESGVHIFEGTRARKVKDGTPCRVLTASGPSITADRVIVATHFPFPDRGLFFARQFPSRSYVVAGRLDAEPPRGMYLSTESSPHSIRVHPGREEEGHLLLIGGEGHKVGEGNESERFEKLASWARGRFDLDEISHRWSSQDNMPADEMPFVGPLVPFSDRILTATGFRKWGLAAGSAAAAALTDAVLDAPKRREWAGSFDSVRLRPRASLVSLVKENAETGFHFVADRLTNRGAPRCTHLGCLLSWNEAESSWDCPCHGSRFSTEGEVLQGPAVDPIEPPPGPP